MRINCRYHSFYFASTSHRSNKFGNAPQTHLRIGYYADKKKRLGKPISLLKRELTDSNGEAVAGIHLK